MALRGRIGGHATAARHDTRETTAKAREVFRGAFEIEVDPDGLLEPEERARRADQARRAFYSRIAYLSAAKRKNRRRATVKETTPRAPSSSENRQ